MMRPYTYGMVAALLVVIAACKKKEDNRHFSTWYVGTLSYQASNGAKSGNAVTASEGGGSIRIAFKTLPTQNKPYRIVNYVQADTLKDNEVAIEVVTKAGDRYQSTGNDNVAVGIDFINEDIKVIINSAWMKHVPGSGAGDDSTTVRGTVTTN